MQKSKKRGNSAFRQFRQRDKTRVGQRHWLIRQSFHQGRVAKRGARLVDGQNVLRCIARKDAAAFSQRDARAVTSTWLNIENGNRRGSRHAVRAEHARI
jgi:hypothetical protein